MATEMMFLIVTRYQLRNLSKWNFVSFHLSVFAETYSKIGFLGSKILWKFGPLDEYSSDATKNNSTNFSQGDQF